MAGAEPSAMIRRAAILLIVFAVAGCAANTPSPKPAAAIPAAPPRGEPSAYLNMQSGALRAAFGMPAFVRKDGVTEMWRYDGQACRAFFFLYAVQGQLAVRHVETLPHGTGQAADMGCLTALRASPPKTS